MGWNLAVRQLKVGTSGRDPRYALEASSGPTSKGALIAPSPLGRSAQLSDIAPPCGFPGVRRFRVVDRRAVFGYRRNSLIRAGCSVGPEDGGLVTGIDRAVGFGMARARRTSSPVAQFFLP